MTVTATATATLCNQLANPLLAVLPGGEGSLSPLPHGPRAAHGRVELPAGKELGVEWVEGNFEGGLGAGINQTGAVELCRFYLMFGNELEIKLDMI